MDSTKGRLTREPEYSEYAHTVLISNSYFFTTTTGGDAGADQSIGFDTPRLINRQIRTYSPVQRLIAIMVHLDIGCCIS